MDIILLTVPDNADNEPKIYPMWRTDYESKTELWKKSSSWNEDE